MWGSISIAPPPAENCRHGDRDSIVGDRRTATTPTITRRQRKDNPPPRVYAIFVNVTAAYVVVGLRLVYFGEEIQ